MGILKIISNKGANFKIGIWKIEESESDLGSKLTLTDQDKCELSTKKSEIKRNQWLSSRMLIQYLHENSITLSYEKSGKPIITNVDLNVSISHSKNLVAVILSDKNCGIDIEYISNKASKVRHKFLHMAENMLPANDMNDTLLWSVKEACYKLFGNDALSFSKHIRVLNSDFQLQGKLEVEIEKANEKKIYTVNYEKILNYFLVYVVE